MYIPKITLHGSLPKENFASTIICNKPVVPIFLFGPPQDSKFPNISPTENFRELIPIISQTDSFLPEYIYIYIDNPSKRKKPKSKIQGKIRLFFIDKGYFHTKVSLIIHSLATDNKTDDARNKYREFQIVQTEQYTLSPTDKKYEPTDYIY